MKMNYLNQTLLQWKPLQRFFFGVTKTCWHWLCRWRCLADLERPKIIFNRKRLNLTFWLICKWTKSRKPINTINAPFAWYDVLLSVYWGSWSANVLLIESHITQRISDAFKLYFYNVHAITCRNTCFRIIYRLLLFGLLFYITKKCLV
jgi:hypothetical protein